MTTQSDSQTMVKINPHEDTAILALSQEAGKLRDYALSRVILSDSDLSPATDDLSVIAKLKKALAEKKIEYLKPFKAHLEILNAAFTLITLPLEEADKITREKILAYRAAAAKRQAEAEEINRQKIELAKREAQFNGTGEITVDTTPVEAVLPVNRVATSMGTASTMKVTKWELIDFKLVPDDFKTLDSGKVTKLVKAGGSIPGIRVFEEESLRITTK